MNRLHHWGEGAFYASSLKRFNREGRYAEISAHGLLIRRHKDLSWKRKCWRPVCRHFGSSPSSSCVPSPFGGCLRAGRTRIPRRAGSEMLRGVARSTPLSSRTHGFLISETTGRDRASSKRTLGTGTGRLPCISCRCPHPRPLQRMKMRSLFMAASRREKTWIHRWQHRCPSPLPACFSLWDSGPLLWPSSAEARAKERKLQHRIPPFSRNLGKNIPPRDKIFSIDPLSLIKGIHDIPVPMLLRCVRCHACGSGGVEALFAMSELLSRQW